MTPFMLAVSGRAYPAAITVLEAAQKIAKGELMAVNLSMMQYAYQWMFVMHFSALFLAASSVVSNLFQATNRFKVGRYFPGPVCTTHKWELCFFFFYFQFPFSFEGKVDPL